jgi:TIR domain
MTGGIFISYRRDDSAGFAGRIYDRVVNRLNRERVFFDVDNIELGVDFVQVLSNRVAECDALVVIIGKAWLSSTDEENRRRLDDPSDLVRIEIETALQRAIPVIPVVVGGASMPRQENLPEVLKPLAHRQGLAISHANFDSDCERLTASLAFVEEARQKREEAAEQHRSGTEAAKRAGDDRRAPDEAGSIGGERSSTQVRAAFRPEHGAKSDHLTNLPKLEKGATRRLLNAASVCVALAGAAALLYTGIVARQGTSPSSFAGGNPTETPDAATNNGSAMGVPRPPALVQTPILQTTPARNAVSSENAAPVDEAQSTGRDETTLGQAGEDFFHDMDNGVQLTPDEVRGRNMWLVWTGGNDRFWDELTKGSLATVDLLKVITSHPSQTYCDGQHCDRDSRWYWLGAINEPCFERPKGPDPKRFGLWLDVRGAKCPADPFEDETEYPGVKIGARGMTFEDGSTLPVGSYFGYASGIIGLRLFPNPDFDQAAKAKWDPERYYTDPNYYNDPNLVRPYRVGMACGFCHVGPSPIHPPNDPGHPEWADLNSTVGAQYLWTDRVFVYSADVKNFIYQLVHSYPPGTMDTSFVSTDYINNPRTMNAIYLLGPRLGEAPLLGKETLKGGELNNRQNFELLPGSFLPPDTSFAPRVLKDGADSVGLLGALNRVYLNIGLYSEEWTRHFHPFFGGKPITPIEIATAEKNSAYWRATEAGTPYMALFLVEAGQPDRLTDAPGGQEYVTADSTTLLRGEKVFAEACARCHSSRLPPEASAKLAPGGCSGPDYLSCFKRYWAYTQTDEFKAKMRAIVAAPDFLKDNYLSTDARIPVTLLRTNVCSPLGTNAIRGNIWDNFSSETYKTLPSVGKVTVQDPFTAGRWQYQMPDGGLGYTRVPSLVSIWSTAPFLLNNRLGPFSDDVSVDGRMKVFDDSIEQLLWPEKRSREPGFDGYIVRTTASSYIDIPKRIIGSEGNIAPEFKNLVASHLGQPFEQVFGREGSIRLGPFPKGFPINLIEIQPRDDIPDGRRLPHDLAVSQLTSEMSLNWSLGLNGGDAAMLAFAEKLRGPLLKLLKCPDFVVNRGHYFGTDEFNNTDNLSDDEKSFGKEPPLSDDDKRALIEFIKTF